MKAVLDTNVVVSAMLVGAGPSGAVVAAWESDSFDLITSEDLLAELRSVLLRPRIRERVRWSDDRLATFLERVRTSASLVEPETLLTVLADDADNRVLEAAVAGAADYVVTGDKAFLDLGVYEGIEIVSPARFAAILSASV